MCANKQDIVGDRKCAMQNAVSYFIVVAKEILLE